MPLWKASPHLFFSWSRTPEQGTLVRANSNTLPIRKVYKLLTDVDQAGCISRIHVQLKNESQRKLLVEGLGSEEVLLQALLWFGIYTKRMLQVCWSLLDHTRQLESMIIHTAELSAG